MLDVKPCPPRSSFCMLTITPSRPDSLEVLGVPYWPIISYSFLLLLLLLLFHYFSFFFYLFIYFFYFYYFFPLGVLPCPPLTLLIWVSVFMNNSFAELVWESVKLTIIHHIHMYCGQKKGRQA